jgi:hypothetical protein
MDVRPAVRVAALAATAASLAALTACERGDALPDVGETGPTSATGTTEVAEVTESADDRFPDVVDVVAEFDRSSGTWAFDVTISSPYDSAERYADGWRVVAPDGTVYGIHTLAHDHAAEQPFTRRQSGVVIPDGVGTVTIEGRDRTNGFGGRSRTISLQTG